MTQYDVVVIGAGVTGCAIARELARYKLKTIVLEKEEDVCSGTSKANSGIVHGGFDAKEGTLMARMNVKGAAMIRELSKKLDFTYRENGSMVLAFSESDLPGLEALKKRGEANGVNDLSILTGDEARELEPALSEEVAGALLSPSAGIVCPFGITIAFAENAADNGVEFSFLNAVQSIEKTDGGYVVRAEKGDLTARAVVNAAGVYSDKINDMVSEKHFTIIPRRGEYVLMDREVGDLVSHTIFQLPTRLGKGVLVTPTAHGNLLVGPNAQDIEDKEDTETTAEGIEDIKRRALLSVPSVPYNKAITGFSGLRAHEEHHDFILGEAEDAEFFFNAAAIESPGLTSSPAIGEYMASLISERLGAEKKESFIETRKGIPQVAKLSPKERAKLIAERPEYGTIVCRCESISEGEILDAIRRTLGARSMDGIKRRVRQGMGRCQAGFCTPRAMELLARELNIAPEEVTKNRPGSELLVKEAE
ncbi:MAG: NAD(P)/FAD-dependent oxidoreductase [Oscillospiraceae bacterium]|nr:NAD(P)/FAD-dependent oxidoreductase [Oscillospiraceae bacterium]